MGTRPSSGVKLFNNQIESLVFMEDASDNRSRCGCDHEHRPGRSECEYVGKLRWLT